jgi:hypothetical protein
VNPAKGSSHLEWPGKYRGHGGTRRLFAGYKFGSCMWRTAKIAV